MAKKKEVLAEVVNGSVRDSLAAALGISTVEGSSFNVFTGIPIPSITFQWLLGCNVVPLSRVFEFAGKSMARKSTFVYEMMRWYLNAGGNVVLLETEGKDSAPLRKAVWKYDASAILERSLVKGETVFEEWMKKVYKIFAYYNEHPPTYPVIIAVDSVAAAGTESMQEEIAKEGITHAKYPILAKELAHNIKNFADKMQKIPVTFCYTNHYKESINGGFGEMGTRLGGKALEFAESCSIKLSPANVRSPKRLNCTMNWLKFDTIKPMMTPRRNVDVLLVYREEVNPYYDSTNPFSSKYRPVVTFDWGETDINFLDGVINDSAGRYNYGAEKRKNLAAAIQLHLNKTKGTGWSERLGMTEADALSYSDLGARLIADPEILRDLQNELGIMKTLPYHSGMDYRQTLVDMTTTIEETYFKPPVILSAPETYFGTETLSSDEVPQFSAEEDEDVFDPDSEE